MVTAKLIRPLNHSYIPNIKNVWPEFTNPWYDGGWQYTVPYTVYTTGIGWRTDKVKQDPSKRSNPYDAFWDDASSRVAVIDDWHTCMAMVLLREGKGAQINSTDPAVLADVQKGLLAMQAATHPKVTITMYNDLPAGQLSLCQMWSGDVVNAVSYLPKGVKPSVLGYWFPPDGRGAVDNDLNVILKGGKNPVLAHLFLNHMLDTKTALGNFSYIGYQPPQNSLDIDAVVSDGYLPANLSAAVVKREYFTEGYRLLELPPAADAAWHQVWTTVQGWGVTETLSTVEPPEAPPAAPPVSRHKRRSSPLLGATALALGADRAAGNRLARCALPLPAVRRPDDRVRPDRPDLPYAAPGLEPGRVEHRGLRRRVQAHRRSGRLLRSGPAADGHLRAQRERAVPHDRLSGGVLHGALRRPASRLAARSADRSVLDQLHDADARLGQPAAERRAHQPHAAHRTSTGSPANRWWSSWASSTDTCRT